MRPASLRGLTLRVVEIRRNGDDGLCDRARPARPRHLPCSLRSTYAEIFGRRQCLVAELQLNDRFAAFDYVKRKELQLVLYIADAAAHEPFDGIDGSFRMRHEHLAGFVAGDHFAGYHVDRHWAPACRHRSRERMRGPVRSITATRLLVVPRSMPTMRGLAWPKSICRVDIQFLFDIAQQVRHVLAAVQQSRGI